MAGETVDSGTVDSPEALAVPGVVAVYSVATPLLEVLPAETEIGRQGSDEAASRRHAKIGIAGSRWRVEDLGSRNGTFVNGARIDSRVEVAPPGVVRIGQTLFLLKDDVRPLADGAVTSDGDHVVGPALRAVLERVRRAARGGSPLLISGESGAGKELLARSFHAAMPGPAGPFLAVNCAAIPEGVAERLLFGTTRGAYSGAVEAEGYLAASDGGVLFLDEIGDLDAKVQPKLLRVLEEGEILPLGATRPRKVNVRFCFAASRSLRAAMNEGRFRAELFFRIAGAEVTLPPLRQRLEEIPWLVAWQVARVDAGLRPAARFVEACLLRRWPGNVRELVAAVRRAAEEALAEGEDTVRPGHLDPEAGGGGPAETTAASPAPAAARELDEAAVRAAMARNGDNLSAVARDLGLHRSQLYRLLKKLGINL